MARIQSKREREKLSDNGYLYVFDKDSSDGLLKFWRCEKKNSAGDRCLARMHTQSATGQVVHRSARGHNHDSDAAGVEVAAVKTSIKRRAEETVELPTQIINNEIQNLGLAVMGQLPKQDAMRKLVQRKRLSVNAAPAAPANLEELVIPAQYTIYEAVPGEEENFLLLDSGAEEPDPNRILVFGREKNMEWADAVHMLYMDGTFRQAPPLFEQIYVILAERNEYVFPLLYALLPNKQRRTYERLFTMIAEKWPRLQPQSISIDYEIAVFPPLQQAFPGVQLSGCLFHLTKNMKQKLAEVHLLQQYNNEPDFALQARMVVAIAFVPIPAIDEAIDAISNSLPVELQPVINWFEDYYIGRQDRNGIRRPAMFPPAIWNCYERVLNGQDRTNNHAEASHRRLQSELQMDHPSLWKLVDGIRKVQKSRDLEYERMVRGDAPPAKRAKYQHADARILRLVQSFFNRPLIEYLRGIAHCFLME